MKSIFRNISVVLFVIILIGFAFPFVTSFYPEGEAITLTGFEMLQSRKEVVNPADSATSELPDNLPKEVPSAPTLDNENLISLSAVSASIGVVTSNLRSPQSIIVTAVASGVGSGALWMMKEHNEKIVLGGEERIERVDFGSGYFTSFCSYIAVFIVNLVRFFQKSKLSKFR